MTTTLSTVYGGYLDALPSWRHDPEDTAEGDGTYVDPEDLAESD